MKRQALTFLFGVLVFATAHTQAPLYYSNQNQYLLHGAARAGVGQLEHDWLANTEDPTPVFSLLVEATYRFLHPRAFHVFHALLLGLYFLAVMGLIEVIVGTWTRASWLGAAMFVTAIHSAAIRYLSVALLGVDYPWFLQCGIANQYVLGPGLQPSSFGVLLLVALHAFACGRPILAAACAAFTVVIHATYAPTAGMLVLAILVDQARRRQWRTAAWTAGTALAIALPIVVRQAIAFGPTDRDAFAEAQRILVHERIPHHALPAKWWDWIVCLQIAWIVVGLAIFARRAAATEESNDKPSLPIVLAGMFMLTALATGLQLIARLDALALLFPWRASAVLAPVASAAVIGALLVRRSRHDSEKRDAIPIACIVSLGLLVAGGLRTMTTPIAYRMSPDEEPLLEYVRTHSNPGDLYLLPIKAPSLAGGKRGTFSTSFTQPPKPSDRNLIAVDLQRFRLATGVPIVVDFKTIPYRDVDVLEWRKRLRDVEWLYSQENWDERGVTGVLDRYGVTHVITAAHRPLASSRLRQIYADRAYRVYVRAR